ncbi:hypothetical protein ES702_06109 [subsurface metagenome]
MVVGGVLKSARLMLIVSHVLAMFVDGVGWRVIIVILKVFLALIVLVSMSVRLMLIVNLATVVLGQTNGVEEVVVPQVRCGKPELVPPQAVILSHSALMTPVQLGLIKVVEREAVLQPSVYKPVIVLTIVFLNLAV